MSLNILKCIKLFQFPRTFQSFKSNLQWQCRSVTSHASLKQSDVALVIGAGDATGSAIAKRFAKEGYTVCAVRRNQDKLIPLQKEIERHGGRCIALGADARKEDSVIELVSKIEEEIGAVKVFVHNIGANVKFDICDTSSKKYYKVWEMACFSAFLTSREVARHMIGRKQGTMIFTGATASVRGGAGFSAFSGAMSAKRMLSQSLARELGPKGIHVAHVVIDGPIDTEFVKEIIPKEIYDSLQKDDGLLSPEGIAENYWNIHKQPISAWTHELDLRPWIEKW